MRIHLGLGLGSPFLLGCLHCERPWDDLGMQALGLETIGFWIPLRVGALGPLNLFLFASTAWRAALALSFQCKTHSEPKYRCTPAPPPLDTWTFGHRRGAGKDLVRFPNSLGCLHKSGENGCECVYTRGSGNLTSKDHTCRQVKLA